MTELSDYTFKDPETAKCPFDYYAQMRAKDPVHLDKGTGWYWIAKYEDVVAMAADHKTFSSSTDVQFRKTFTPAAQRELDEAGVKIVDTLVTSDPPDSDEYRTVAAKWFPPSKVSELLPKIHATSNALIDAFIDNGGAELNFEYSRRLVGTILAEQLGLPLADLDRFKEWAEVTGELMAIGITEEAEVRGVKKMIELVRYLRDKLRRAATEGTPGTVIHTIATSNKRDGSPFSSEERTWMTFLSFTTSNNTTVNMLNTVLRTLAGCPDLQIELRANLEKVPSFIEEMLRLEGSSQALARTVMQDVEIGGKAIPKGSLVWLCIGSANRDESRWGGDASKLKLDRADVRKHVGFGTGRHQCIGLHLARAELRATVVNFLSRLENIRLADPSDPPEQLPLPYHRGIKNLKVRFDKLV